MLFLQLLLTVAVSVAAVHTERAIPRDSFIRVAASSHDALHEVTFAVKQNNIDLLERELQERGTPGTALFQKWLKREDIVKLTRNDIGSAAVKNFLAQHNIQIVGGTDDDLYLKARAPISVWQNMFATQFFEWEDAANNNNRVHRAEHYTMPEAIAEHVVATFGTVQVPPVLTKHVHFEPADFKTATNDVTVQFLNTLYKIPSNQGSSKLVQGVFETSTETMSTTDLTDFQKAYGLTVQAAVIQGTTASSKCTFNTCGEGNLDIQYIMGVAQQTQSIFWFQKGTVTNDPFVDSLTSIAASSNPPTVLSNSWGTIENGYSASHMSAYNTEAIKVSSMGITILAASGDNGASGDSCQCTVNSGSSSTSWSGTGSWSGQGYFPNYPATNPYTVAVGATMGPENGDPESVCMSNHGGVITSGGGFSTYWPTPSYQTKQVSAYLSTTKASAGYNPKGRGYPDVSMIGVDYPIYVNGAASLVFGTSASTPVLAALISLVNAARLAKGLGTVGYIHPSLYGASASLFTDVTSGENNCCAGSNATAVTCCTSGFTAAPGWDAATGLGSITYNNLLSILSGSAASSLRGSV